MTTALLRWVSFVQLSPSIETFVTTTFQTEGALQLVRRKTECCKDGRDCASYAAVAQKKVSQIMDENYEKCLVGSRDPLQAILLAFALLNSGYSGIHTNLLRL